VAWQTPGAPAFEKAAIEALGRETQAPPFPIEVYAVSVPMPGHPGLAGVYVTILGGGLTSAGNAKIGTFTAGALVFVRFRDGAGNVAAKGSQEFPIHGLMADAKSTLAKPVRFSRLFDLAPGPYRLEVAVYDEAGKQASVVKTDFEVPSATLPVVGDLMIVQRAEKLPQERPEDAGNPLITKDHILLHPEYDAGVNRGLQPEVSFILPLVLAPQTAPPPSTLGLLSSKGETLVTVALPLGTADASGRLLAIGRVPLAKIPPGKYRLQVTVGAGVDARIRTASLTVVD
jgi:hypothetical protein